jgi:hypothetical protein
MRVLFNERYAVRVQTKNDHWDGILSNFDKELTTGFLERVNSLKQTAKARSGLL